MRRNELRVCTYAYALMAWKSRSEQTLATTDSRGVPASREPSVTGKGQYRQFHPMNLEDGSGGWIRTNDLRVMSPTSCHCSTPQRMYGDQVCWRGLSDQQKSPPPLRADKGIRARPGNYTVVKPSAD